MRPISVVKTKRLYCFEADDLGLLSTKRVAYGTIKQDVAFEYEPRLRGKELEK